MRLKFSENYQGNSFDISRNCYIIIAIIYKHPYLDTFRPEIPQQPQIRRQSPIILAFTQDSQDQPRELIRSLLFKLSQDFRTRNKALDALENYMILDPNSPPIWAIEMLTHTAGWNSIRSRGWDSAQSVGIRDRAKRILLDNCSGRHIVQGLEVVAGVLCNNTKNSIPTTQDYLDILSIMVTPRQEKSAHQLAALHRIFDTSQDQLNHQKLQMTIDGIRLYLTVKDLACLAINAPDEEFRRHTSILTRHGENIRHNHPELYRIL